MIAVHLVNHPGSSLKRCARCADLRSGGLRPLAAFGDSFRIHMEGWLNHERLYTTQGRYLSFIHTYVEGFGLPPAESEIAEHLGVSPPSAHQMIKTLEKKGLIRRQPGKARSIEILVDPETIPKWKGKRISRTVMTWTRVGPCPPRREKRSGMGAKVYRFKITLQGTSPAIWRRIETRDVTLGRLHELIQAAMGWTNSHLHQFEISGVRYAAPRFMMGDFDDFGAEDYGGVYVSNLVAKHGSRLRMRYEYDFGDGWEHEVVLESVHRADSGVKYPRCVDGQRACPPEDVGGVWGFANYVAAVTDPSHSEHDELLEWNGPFDPAAFDAKQATRRMKKGLPV